MVGVGAWICIHGNVTIIIVDLQDQGMEGIGMATLMISTVLVIDYVLIPTTNIEAIQIDSYVMNFVLVRKRYLVLEEKDVAYSGAATGSKKIVPKEDPDMNLVFHLVNMTNPIIVILVVKDLVQSQEPQVAHVVMIIIILVARAVTPIGIKASLPTMTKVPSRALVQVH